MKLITSLLALAGSCLATKHALNTSDIIDFNVTRSSYHITVANNTDVDFGYWSLDQNNIEKSANGTGITVAIIGDGVNSYFLPNNTRTSVTDVITNSSFIFKKDELTEDTLAAKVLLSKAPSASIKSFKIFKYLDSTTTVTSVLAKAVAAAINDVDVDLIFINTWQSYGGWSKTVFSEFLNEAAKFKPIVLPMGQSNGIFQMSDGASSENVISVGGSGFDGIPGFPININGTIYGGYANSKFNVWENNTLTLGELDSSCHLKKNVSNDETDILFFEVGNCTAKQVSTAILNSNFTQVLTTGETWQLYTFDEELGIVSAMLGQSAGQVVLKDLQDKKKLIVHNVAEVEHSVLVDFDFDEFSINFNSSMGPTLDLFLKPNILAQTNYFFEELNIYASGTSLSAALVSGIIAAYGSRFNESSQWYDGLIERVTTSGSLVNFRNLTDTFIQIENPIVQGGGIINTDDFISRTFDISPGYFSLNDFQNCTEFTFTLTNNDVNPKKYRIGGVEAITIYSQSSDVDANNNNMYTYPIFGNDSSSEVVFDKNTVIVKGGKSRNITVLITPPDYSTESSRLPVYGGYIEVIDVEANIISNIPYFGAAVEMNSLNTQTEEKFYWKEMHYEKEGIYCDMWVNGSVINDTNHYMQIYFGDRIGTPIVDILVVDKDWEVSDFKYPPVPGKDKFVERIQGVRTPGGFPWHNAPRTNQTNSDQWDDWHDGMLADGTILPDGEYKILLRMLKHNVEDLSDWDQWYNHVSPWFIKLYENVTEIDLPSTTISVTSHLSTTLATLTTTSESHASMLMSGMGTGISMSMSMTMSSSTSIDMSGMKM